MTLPPLGITFHAIILKPPSTQYVKGEVVKGKIVTEKGDFRIRPFWAKEVVPMSDFSGAYFSFLKVIPNIKCTVVPILPSNVWARHKREHRGRWFSRETSRSL